MDDFKMIKSELAKKFKRQAAGEIHSNDWRIWGVEKIPALSHAVHKVFFASIMRAFAFYNETRLGFTVMANRVMCGEVGSGGGWHQDSVLVRQFKAFVYLTDVLSVEDGPVQHFDSKQSFKIRLRELCRFNFSNRVLSEPPSEAVVVSETHSAGEVFELDTRRVHRGAPLGKNAAPRLALTLYIYGKKRPPQMQLTEISIGEVFAKCC